MSEQNAKGRRAADRRRERQSQDDAAPGRDRTSPGQAADPGQFESAQTAAFDGRPEGEPARELKSGTHVTSMTSVGTAAQDMLKQGPLERTKVRPVSYGPALDAGRLICLEGKDIGKSFELTHDVMVVGRGKDAHVKLSDPAVSRAHFEMRFDYRNFQFYFHPVVTDPPPQLNGEEAAGSARELGDGDVIEIGESTLRFVRVEGPPPAQREAPKPPEEPAEPQMPSFGERTRAVLVKVRTNARIMKRVIGAAIVAAAVLVVLGAVGIRFYVKAAREASLNDAEGAYQQLLKQARAMRESRRWDELADTAKAVATLAPERDDGARLKQEADDEKLAERNLGLGRMNYASGKYDEARSVLRLIPETSIYRAERDGLLEKANEIGRAGGIEAIRRLMSEGRYREAAERADQHLANYRDDEEAAALRGSAVRMAAAREALGTPGWQSAKTKALSSLDTGDFTGAVELAQRGGGADGALAGNFVGRVKTLQSNWREGKALLGKKSPKALEPLRRAHDVIEDLNGGRGALARDIDNALADAYYLAGVDAFSAGKECDARVLFERGATYNGGDSKLRNQLSRLATKGRELLGKAEAARARGASGDARRLAREAVCRLPKGDGARARAEKIAGGKG